MTHLLMGLLTVMPGLAADDRGAEAAKKDLERMQGEWALESMIRDGERIPDDDAQALFRSVKGTEYTVSRYDKVAGKGTFALDAFKQPREIDIRPKTAAADAKPILGIYELNGDTLKMCYGQPGKPRPTAFESKEGSGITLTVWKREKP